MRYLIPMLIFLLSLAPSAAAMEITAPEVAAAGAEVMPQITDSFAAALLELVENTLFQIRPDLMEAGTLSLTMIAAMLILTFLNTLSGNVKKTAVFAGTILIASTLLSNANTMIQLGSDTIMQLSNYGKLLFPVMTTAMAAQGGITSSAALYAGTAAFDAFLGSLIANIFVPMVYLFLALAVAHSALGESPIKQLRDFIKNSVSWCLKTILTIFTTYMSITGVVSGTTDAAALKATKVTISSVVPVIGGILSDASEAVLVGAGIMKNAAGIYGILAILALFLEPFLRIGSHYLLLKATAALCGIFGTKELTALIDDFASAMGLLLAMTGAVCLLLLISMICFLKGVG